MSIIPSGKRRVSAQSLMYQNTGLDGTEVSQEVATNDPSSSGPASNFEQLQNDLNSPKENVQVPDMSMINDQGSVDEQNSMGGGKISSMRNELIDALAQVDVDPERARLVAKKALTIGYKNPSEDILSGEFLVPSKEGVDITQIKSVFAPIIENNGFTLTQLKPHQNTGKSGKKVIDYWKLEFETKVEDPNAQQTEGDYSDMMDDSNMGGQNVQAMASRHSFIKDAGRSLLLDSLIEQFSKKGRTE